MSSGLAKVADLVRRETGIVLPAARQKALHAALERAAPGLSPDAFVRAASEPPGGRDLMDRLIDEVTNQETFFLRDRGQLDEIAWRSLFRGACAAGSGTIRVWSAGCATGEEAYTLALLADQAFAPAPAPVNVLGTDISRAALAAAAGGRYSRAGSAGAEPSLCGRYFQPQPDGSYLVGDRCAGWCASVGTTSRGRNYRPPAKPASTSSPAGTCSSTSRRRSSPHVIGALERSLRPDGMLLLGAADALHRPARSPAAGKRPAGRQAAGPAA